MRASVTVTKPRRGSLMRRSSISATMRWMRSAILRARAASTIVFFLFVEEPLPGGQQLQFGTVRDERSQLSIWALVGVADGATTATPILARRYRSCSPTSETDTENFRRSSD